MDSGAADDWGVAASERVYQALTRAYPEEMRRRYAGEMVGYFGDLCREERMSRGPRGVALLWARTLPELLFTALQERGAQFRGNAYLPVAPRKVARWGALCALLGGILGVAFFMSRYVLYAASDSPPVALGPFARFFTDSLLLCALPLSSLGLFGLYGAVVARSGEARPGPLAGAGAVFSTASASLWLVICGYAMARQLASGTALFAPFEWLWYTGAFVGPLAILSWFLGLLLLGMAAARQRRLLGHLRALPLGLFALAVPGCMAWLGVPGVPRIIANSEAASFVLGFAPTLLFVGVAMLGWALLEAARGHDAEPLAISDGPAGSAAAGHGMARSVGRNARRVRGARSGTSDVEAAKEKELLEALRRRGALTAAGVALETSLSVEEADRMLSELAGKGHLEVRAERGRLLYSLWESDG